MSALRRAVLAHLAAHAVLDGDAPDIALALSEAITNAAVHAYRDRPPGEIHVSADVQDGHMVICVRDDGDGMVPRPDSPGLGLGLPLIAEAADEFELRGGPGGRGTEVVMRFRVQRRP